MIIIVNAVQTFDKGEYLLFILETIALICFLQQKYLK